MRIISTPVSGICECVAGVGDWSDERGNNTFAPPKLFLTRLMKEGILSFARGYELVKFTEFWEVSSRARSWFSLLGWVPRVPFLLPSSTWTHSWGSRVICALRHSFCCM